MYKQSIMLSKASKYAIRAVIFIVRNPRGEKYGAKQIAKELQIPAPFLSKVLQKLTKNNIISSVKGPNGGFFVSSKNHKKSILEIVDCIDGTSKFHRCFLGEAKCNNENPCEVHFLYLSFKEGVLNKLRSKTIEKIAKENESLKGIL